MSEESDQGDEPFRLVNAAQAELPLLFRYQAFDAARLRRVLCERALYFSNPADFNDPWDCRPWYDLSFTSTREGVARFVDWYIDITKRRRPDILEPEVLRRAEIYRADPALIRAKIAESSNEMEKAIQEQYRVYCLGEFPDCELMWAHYAAKHGGIVLAFSTRNEVFSGALQVNYRKIYASYNLSSNEDQDSLAVLLTKSAAWSYEHEYRLIAQNKETAIGETLIAVDRYLSMPKGCVKAVILGCLASKETADAVSAIIAECGEEIALRRAVRARDRYELVIA